MRERQLGVESRVVSDVGGDHHEVMLGTLAVRCRIRDPQIDLHRESYMSTGGHFELGATAQQVAARRVGAHQVAVWGAGGSVELVQGPSCGARVQDVGIDRCLYDHCRREFCQRDA